MRGKKVYYEIKEIITPDGTNIPTKAIIYNKTAGYM